MRYLNKIVFINSANIPYAEVKVDGNVHLIGTQGVGKSTLLRALLFFYNADKLKLGIPKEKFSFDQYYFRHANSYIIYEVMRETGAYFIIAFRHQGRVCFRFVDTAYNKDYFMDSNGNVTAEGSEIRSRIGKEYAISKIIDRYENYRDIIFGNRTNTGNEYRKYAIVESSKYQNIPRTIQNVFLNSKLDANFIKETIIRSLNDDEIGINLDFYRNQISEFEQNYNDVELWFHKGKNGQVAVRISASRVSRCYHDVIYAEKQIYQLCQQLNFAMKRDADQLPLLEEKRTEYEKENGRLLRLISDEKGKYETERDKCVKEIAVVAEKLSSIREKNRHYTEINISDICLRVDAESQQKKELARQQTFLHNLTSAYHDITDKYIQLENGLNQAFEQFRLEQEAIRNDHQKGYNEQLGREQEKYHLLAVKAHSEYDEDVKDIDKQLTSLAEEVFNIKTEKVKIQNAHPFIEETASVQTKIDELRKRRIELEAQSKLMKERADTIIQKSESEAKVICTERDNQLKDLDRQVNEIQDEVTALHSLLLKSKGSLYEWLEAHKPDWKENIGCVADEHTVLYNTSLNPHLKSDSDTFFGVQIDTNAIERTLRTPEDLRTEKAEKEQALKAVRNEQNEIRNQAQNEVETLRKKYTTQIQKIRTEKHDADAELLQVPVLIKNAEVELDALKQKEENWRKQKMQMAEQQLNSLIHRQNEISRAKEQLKADRDKRIVAIEKNELSAKKILENTLHVKLSEIDDVLTVRRSETDKHLGELNARKKSELAGKGLDTTVLDNVDARIKSIQQELDYIEHHRSTYYDYLKDKRELLDREQDIRERKLTVERKQKSLESHFNDIKVRHERLKLANDECLEEVKSRLKMLQDGLSKADKFITDDKICPPQLHDAGEVETLDSVDNIVDTLRTNIFDKSNKTDTFRSAVNNFKGYFSSKNTFHFRVDLNTDADYMAFAQDLCDFIDNNKISDYQSRVSSRYGEIIQRISKEVGDILKHSSEIDKTINDINADFRERNFAGVIRNISLRSTTSDDPLMHLLYEVKNFNDENIFRIGEMNLFSLEDNRDEVNRQIVRYLFSLSKILRDEPGREQLSLTDTFKLEFRIVENDNDTGWVEKISNVGSDGTDVLVKAIVNIMLLNVFKEKVARRSFGEFRLHCMMDEIGRLHPDNVKGLLDFASKRNIYLVNGSPTAYNVSDYKYTYLLRKDEKSDTSVVPLIVKR